jgi:hypothetical protein
MRPERTQDTDLFIMMEFGKAIAPLRGQEQTLAWKHQFGDIAAPFMRQLKAKGHSTVDAADLLWSVFKLPPK